MREITRDGTLWRVREVDTSHVPGARADRCLIVETEALVRRVWMYPEAWEELSDDELWRVLNVPPHHAIRVGPDAVTELTRSVLDEIRGAAESAEWTLTERHGQRKSCIEARRRMQEAVKLYAESLRKEGVPPERALVLLKTAVQSGLSKSCDDEPVAEALLHEGVEWCIAAYYAA